MLNVTRRIFLQAGVVLVQAASARARTRSGGRVPPGEWWAGGGPREAASSATIVTPDEPGERLILRGTVYGADGETPLHGVTVYVYQTDVHGLYNPEAKFGAPHRIKGWANSDDHGRYEFHTIKPGHYPNRTSPAHIHMTVCRNDIAEWWLPEVRFEGDRLLTAEDRLTSAVAGRFGNVRSITKRGGILYCTRDLRL